MWGPRRHQRRVYWRLANQERCSQRAPPAPKCQNTNRDVSRFACVLPSPVQFPQAARQPFVPRHQSDILVPPLAAAPGVVEPSSAWCVTERQRINES